MGKNYECDVCGENISVGIADSAMSRLDPSTSWYIPEGITLPVLCPKCKKVACYQYALSQKAYAEEGKVKSYFVCDGVDCNEKIQEHDCQSGESLKSTAFSRGWMRVGNNDFCPECVQNVFDLDILTQTSRKMR